MKTPFFRVAAAVLTKDLRAEFRSKELTLSMIVFALLSILIFSFALELDRVARKEAISGVLWVTIAFSSILGLNRSLSLERDQGSFDAMMLAPIERTAIFTGKLIANFLFSMGVGVVLLPLMLVLYNLQTISFWLVLVLFMGTLGFSIIGTLLATMTVQARTREMLLPIVMLPLALPVILAVVKGTTGILNVNDEWAAWVQILAFIDIVYFIMCFMLFDFVVQEH